ncbi:hypothetical protein BYT27DRAFT_6959342 [Phlegmacium glaucopus]|nr:hypothetical protein BYT27DRAFT_6959342 [Phlegmacium glaucopus]
MDIQMLITSIKIIAGSPILESYREFLHAFRWVTTKGLMIDDLILVFLHALADNLTSNSSTFSYTTAQCEKLFELLKISPDRIHEGNIVAYVGQNLLPCSGGDISVIFQTLYPSPPIGRTRSIILYNRYETHYGEEQFRLSRDCTILVDKSKEVQWTRPLLSLLSIQTSDRYLTVPDAIYADQYVYIVERSY